MLRTLNVARTGPTELFFARRLQFEFVEKSVKFFLAESTLFLKMILDFQLHSVFCCLSVIPEILNLHLCLGQLIHLNLRFVLRRIDIFVDLIVVLLDNFSVDLLIVAFEVPQFFERQPFAFINISFEYFQLFLVDLAQQIFA